MKILVNSQLIEYMDEGSGKVLVMLHGWGSDYKTFDKLANHLIKKFRVIRFDFPGFGQSPNPSDDWSVGDYAKLTDDLIKKLKIDNVYAIIAHSFGGRVVIKGNSLGLLKSDKLVFIGVAGVKPKQHFKNTSYKLIAKIGKILTSLPLINKFQPLLRKKLYKSAGNEDYLNAGHMSKIFLNVINEDLLPEVSNIKQSTLLIWGEDDTETPISDARLIAKALQDAKLVTFPDAGHFVYNEAFDDVVKELDKFL